VRGATGARPGSLPETKAGRSTLLRLGQVDDQRDATPAAGPELVGDGQGHRDIIIIGGSAGALDAMLDIVGAFPAEFAGNIFIVSHIGANRSHLPVLMTQAGRLPAAHPENSEPIRRGRIYIAPPDQHMLVEDGHIRLSRGPRHHFTCPAIDPLLRSAAESFGPRVIGVVLSGTGSDGTAGLAKVQQAGGMTVIQEPTEALYPEMPRTAAREVQVDYAVGRAELPTLLRRLSSETIAMKASPTRQSTSQEMSKVERPVALTCPECGGALREAGGAGVKQYRCHIGHRFSAAEVLDGQIDEVDRAIGVALRVLNERIELCRHMSEDAREGGRSMGVAHWKRLRDEAEEQLQVLQQFLARPPARPVDENGNGLPEPVGSPARRKKA